MYNRNSFPLHTINAWNVPLDCPATNYCDGAAMTAAFAKMSSSAPGKLIGLGLICDMADWADEIRASQFGG